MAEFRWNDWNLDHATRHGVSRDEAEAVVNGCRSPFPEEIGDEKLLVIGRGVGGRFAQVIYLPDEEDTTVHHSCQTADGSRKKATKETTKMSRRTKTSPYEKFAALSAAEKEQVYKECDDPDVALGAKRMSPRMKALWNRAKNKGGRPRVGRGAARVLISIERGLLEDADALARRRRMSRSELFSRGVRAVLAKAG